ncbi:hypothetical protein [Pelagibacterium montanilacus]|uniref:hypothetical protein n=1 Tax=Pelagibacterium montanilacus TaxID=2185280 RepID=UPI001FE36654|nr:hypothetical protein [Pelagibacterium montanilacus]
MNLSRYSPLLASLCLFLLSAGPALAQQLSEAEIRSEIIGKRIYLAAPLGGEFPLNYLRSGEVNGDGEALGLGAFIQPRDTGRWWIEAGRLCQQFQTWYDGQPLCFVLSWTGPDSVTWVGDNGETGTARIEG